MVHQLILSLGLEIPAVAFLDANIQFHFYIGIVIVHKNNSNTCESLTLVFPMGGSIRIYKEHGLRRESSHGLNPSSAFSMTNGKHIIL